jgi:hypothetical protein
VINQKKNFMDYIPVCNPVNSWDVNKKDMVVVHVVNRGFYNWIAQKIFKRPKVSHIVLDEYGSFVWQKMDGKRTVFDISKLVSEHFGKDAEPVVERLVTYVQILYQNKFIGYVKQN